MSLLYPFLSGTFAALASVFAKLFTDSRTALITQQLCDILNFRQAGIREDNAILGNVVFGEALSFQWWIGASFIVVGTMLVNKSNLESKDKEK
ncbi:7929_t:CDS:2, partial [Acaulospora morrowiae]